MRNKPFIYSLIFTSILFALGVFLYRYGYRGAVEYEKEMQLLREAKALYIEYLSDIRQSFAKEMYDEFQLVCGGVNGRLNEKIQGLGMEFDTDRRATLEEARTLQLLVMDRFVKAINGHEKIQPFLEVRPFSFRRIRITINFKGPLGHYADGSIYYVNNCDEHAVVENENHLFYYSMDPFTGHSYQLFREPYEEALKLVSINDNPYFHKTTKIENAFDLTIFTYTLEMVEKHHLKCTSIGGKITDKVEEFGGCFNLYHSATLKEARKLILTVAERLIHTINQGEEIKPFLIEYPFPTQRISLRVNFMRKNGLPYQDGTMESVAIENNTISYYQEPLENSDFTPIHTPLFFKESHQDALRIVSEK